MSKYIKFNYSAGYVGTDTSEIYVFSDDATETEIEQCYKEWVEEQHSWQSGLEEITKQEAERLEDEEGTEIIE